MSVAVIGRATAGVETRAAAATLAARRKRFSMDARRSRRTNARNLVPLT
jgi:hypothetical protein